jgi:hypothetical protein
MNGSRSSGGESLAHVGCLATGAGCGGGPVMDHPPSASSHRINWLPTYSERHILDRISFTTQPAHYSRSYTHCMLDDDYVDTALMLLQSRTQLLLTYGLRVQTMATLCRVFVANPDNRPSLWHRHSADPLLDLAFHYWSCHRFLVITHKEYTVSCDRRDELLSRSDSLLQSMGPLVLGHDHAATFSPTDSLSKEEQQAAMAVASINLVIGRSICITKRHHRLANCMILLATTLEQRCIGGKLILT